MEDHVHRGYKHKRKLIVGCDECKRLAMHEDKRYMMRVQKGATDRNVPAAPSRKIVKSLMSKGFTLRGIQRASGVSRETLGEMINRRGNETMHIKQSTEDRLRKLLHDTNRRPDKVTRSRGRSDTVSSDLAKAAIRGLMLRGYPQGWIAERLGTNNQVISDILNGRHSGVSKKHDKKLIELARKYGTTDGPSKRIRTIAQKRGYESTVMHDEFL